MKHFLLVDDALYICKLFKDMVESMTASKLTYVHTIEGAEKLIETETYDGYIIDLNLPGNNGFYLVDALKANPKTKDKLMIIVSAMHFEEIKEYATGKGVEHFFSKLDVATPGPEQDRFLELVK